MKLKQIHRDDALQKITGKAQYCDDLHVANMAYGAIVRSPVAKGILRNINAKKALKLEGVLSVFGANDCNGGLDEKESRKFL